MSDYFDKPELQSKPKEQFDMAAALAGLGNEALLGIPEAVVRQIAGEGGKKAIDDYIEKHKESYGSGGLVGSIGSSFIPVVGLGGKIAKGAKMGAEALGAGKTAEKIGKIATGLDKLQNVKSGAGLIGKGALEGLIQQGIRSTASNDQDALQNIGLSTGLGAAGGVLGGALSRAKFGVEELGEEAAKGTLATALETPTRVLQNWLKGMSPGSLSKKLESITPKINEAADIVAGNNLAKISLIPKADKPEKAFEWFQVVKGHLDDMDKAYLSNPKPIDDSLIKSFDNVIADVSKEVRGDISGFGNITKEEVERTAGNLLLDVLDSPTLIQKRVDLNNLLDRSYMGMKNGDPYKAVQYFTALNAKNALTEVTADFADSLGASGKLYKQALKEYGVLEGLVAPSLFRAESKIGSTGGSATAEKMASQLGISKILAGEEVPVSGLAQVLGGNIIGRAVNVAAPYLADRAGAQTRKALLATGENPLFQKAAGKLEEGLGEKIGKGVGTAAAQNIIDPEKLQVAEDLLNKEEKPIEGKEIDPTIPSMNRRQAEIIAGGDPAKLESMLVQGVAEGFLKMTKGRYGQPTEDNPQFIQFLTSVTDELIDPETKEFNPEIVANILFDNADDKKKYLRSIDALQKVDTTQKQASEASGIMGSIKGLLGTSKPENVASKQALIGSIGEVGKVSGADTKDVEKLVESVLGSGDTDAVKKKKLLDIMKQFNPDLKGVTI